MYHRISASGHSRARRWRLTPDEFEEQLAHLRDGGYRSIDIDEWAAAVDQDRSVPARSVVLSFDDGFADFGEHAVPLLQRYGFRAELFVVTDHVGGMDSWDEGWDAREPLLDWTALLDLPPEVVRIGSHTARHRALTAVSPREAVHELVRSRVELEERLGRRVASIAYPYGLVDGAVARLAGAVGYEVGFTTMPWWVYPSRNLLQLPRLEVRGGDALSTFARMVERPVV
jgi:peptidoglycan/xylan/chitin deacetylase (PgdA/CDA1 family)